MQGSVRVHNAVNAVVYLQSVNKTEIINIINIIPAKRQHIRFVNVSVLAQFQ